MLTQYSPYFLFVIGFIILIKGSSVLIDGASSFANRMKVTTWLIGITIVGIGTSIPEFIITIFSSLRGNFDIGLGTIIGSNTFNLLFILGICAMLQPLVLKKDWILKGLPPNIFSVLLAALVAVYPILGNRLFYGITNPEGMLLLGTFLVWLTYVTFRKKPIEQYTKPCKFLSLPKASVLIIIGLVGVIVGGEWVVGGAIAMAKLFGVSQALVGLTIVGIGTSLPELAVSAVASYKKQFGIAVGNVVGSNIFDFLGILGIASLFQPILFSQKLIVDISVTLFATVLLFITMYTDKKYTITRAQGLLFVFLYLAYMAFILQRG